jgi:ubiquinone/menaquinone biosynthesis C-methylase UbiE
MEESDYDQKFYGRPNLILQKENEHLLNLLKSLDLTEAKCLDYGCGTGYWTSVLAGMGAESFGVDSSHERISHCVSNFSKIDFRSIKGCALPFADDYFDFVLSTWVLQEIEEEKVLRGILDEIRRSVKTKGRLLVVDNVYPDRRVLFQHSIYGDLFFQDNKSEKLRFFQNNSIEHLMTSRGFRQLSHELIGDSFFQLFEKC